MRAAPGAQRGVRGRRALREDMKTQAAEMLEAAGCTGVETYDDDAPMGFSVHEMGTARMGRDPRTSVLNGHNQAHDVPNLFVTDGACMASSSCVNPSITYMALTARAVSAMYVIDGLTQELLVMHAPSVTNRLGTSCAWLWALSTDVFGSRPIRAVPIS